MDDLFPFPLLVKEFGVATQTNKADFFPFRIFPNEEEVILNMTLHTVFILSLQRMRKIFCWYPTCTSKVFKYFLEFIKFLFVKLHCFQVFLELGGLFERIFEIWFLFHLLQRLLT